VLEAAGLQADLRRAGVEPWAWVVNQSLAAAQPASGLLRLRAAQELPQIQAVMDEHASRYAIVPVQMQGTGRHAAINCTGFRIRVVIMKGTMKPIRIFQHESCEGLGYLEPFLTERGISREVVQIGRGEPAPPAIDDVSGLIFLGSSHSVNDGEAWIADELSLIREASQAGLPVLGICFGGQLISKALGGKVSKASAMQAGWFEVKATEQAKAVMGNAAADSFEVFEWHDDVFSQPESAALLFYGDCVRNQGFLHGRCLALQFHPEFTRSKIESCLSHNPRLDKTPSDCVQSGDQMLEGLDNKLARMHAVADALFSWWLTLVRKQDIEKIVVV